MAVDAQRQEIEIPLQDASHIGGCLTGPHACVVVSDGERVCAQLDGGDVTRDPGPQALLGEEQADRTPSQGVAVLVWLGLHSTGESYDRLEGRAVQVGDGEEVHALPRSAAPTDVAASIMSARVRAMSSADRVRSAARSRTVMASALRPSPRPGPRNSSNTRTDSTRSDPPRLTACTSSLAARSAGTSNERSKSAGG